MQGKVRLKSLAFISAHETGADDYNCTTGAVATPGASAAATVCVSG